MPTTPYLKRLKRYFVAALTGWTLVLGALLAWSLEIAYDTTLELARKEAFANFNKDQAFRFWATMHGGVYVPVTETTPPNPRLAHVPERDIATPSGRNLTLMNPAYMVRQLNEEFASLFGVRGHITSEKLIRPENAPDPWERQALRRFAAGEDEVLEVSEIEGRPYMRFMRPMYAEKGCLKCHGDQGYKEGDLRGGVSVAVPLAPHLASEREVTTAAILSYLLVWLVGMTGITYGWRRLTRDHLELERAHGEIRALNEGLEQRVRERTAELEAANQELDAFSYSVSHDLRSPLNAIGGFSGALLEDYGDRLDESGRDYLHRLIRSSERMGALIEDMLKLSRMTRGELHRETLDLSGMATEIVREMHDADPGRDVAVSIVPGLAARGDARLLRVALENLLRNAWKYTSTTEGARVVFEGTPDGFVVRDNGVGFDMAYADKLFAPFKRLHNAEAFPGSGIGLATVQRIIHRHGGRIWGEGRVGEGAAFYFTLPD